MVGTWKKKIPPFFPSSFQMVTRGNILCLLVYQKKSLTFRIKSLHVGPQYKLCKHEKHRQGPQPNTYFSFIICQHLFNSLQHNRDFLRPCLRNHLKTLWEKEKMQVTYIFSFSTNVFYPSQNKF